MQLDTYMQEGNRISDKDVWSLTERLYGRVIESRGTYLILENGDKIPRSQWKNCRVTQPLQP